MADHPRRAKGTTTKRLRLTAAERAQILGDYRASGLTQEHFAAEHRLKVATLRNWIYRATPSRGVLRHALENERAVCGHTNSYR